MSAAEHFEDWLDEDAAPVAPYAEGFHIRDDGGADWALRTRAKALERIAAAKAEYDAWQDKLTKWLAARTASDTATVAFMEMHLQAFHKRLYDEALAAGERPPKTYPLPSGKLVSRAGTPRAEVIDQDALVAWLQANAPDLLKVEPKVGEVKGAFTVFWTDSDEFGVEEEAVLLTAPGDEGERVPGVRLIRPERSFGVS